MNLAKSLEMSTYAFPDRTVVIDEALVQQIQQDIKAGLSKQGIQNRTFEDLFGDLHGDFERY